MTWIRGHRRKLSGADDYERAYDALRRRLGAFDDDGVGSIVRTPEAMSEAGALWRAASPADSGAPTTVEKERLEDASYLIGCLHAYRLSMSVDEDLTAPVPEEDLPDLAQAVVLLTPFTGGPPELIPTEVRSLILPSTAVELRESVVVALLMRLRRYEDPMAARAGIILGLMALHSIPGDLGGTLGDHESHAVLFSHLGGCFKWRARATRDVSDADSAIQALEFAVAAAGGRSDVDEFHINLQAAHQLKLDLTVAPPPLTPAGLAPADIESSDALGGDSTTTKLIRDLEAILTEERASEDLGPYLTVTSRAFEHLASYRREGVAAGLEAALQLLGEALKKTRSHPGGRHRGRAEALANLGDAHLMRYRRTGSPPDLQAAINYGQRSLVPDPDGNRNLGRIDRLVAAYQCQIESTDEEPSLDDVRRLWSLARTSTDELLDVGVVVLAGMGHDHRSAQVSALRKIAKLAQSVDANALAVAAFRDATWFLARVAHGASSWTGQEQMLAPHYALVGEAVSAQLACDDVVGALETAELGRGLVVSSRMTLTPSDFGDTRLLPSDQAHRLHQILGHSKSGQPAASLTYADWAAKAELNRSHTATHFPGPPTWREAIRSSTSQTVVLVNAGPRRSDAILLRPGDDHPLSVALPRLSAADLRLFTGARLWAADDHLTEMLEWLWETTIEPVLGALGHTSPMAVDQPGRRICWIPTGRLALLPLHAAGVIGGPSALDRVVSSYSPTIRMLTELRRRRPRGRRHLTVALPQTPGQPGLPGTVAETQALHKRFPESPALIDAEATTARVLAAMKTTSWVHFACHAINDLSAPSRSHLVLHDRLLLLPEIARLGLEDGELAYLSACSTAQTGFGNPDEVTHLTSAFHLAGYRHVVASLWPLNDEVAAHASDRFYELLADAPDAGGAAAAVNRIARELRDLEPERPELWAPLVHSGP